MRYRILCWLFDSSAQERAEIRRRIDHHDREHKRWS